MFFHVILTNECTLQCRYCFGEALEDFGENFSDFDVDYALPKRIAYKIEELDNFCRKDTDCVFNFLWWRTAFVC